MNPGRPRRMTNSGVPFPPPHLESSASYHEFLLEAWVLQAAGSKTPSSPPSSARLARSITRRTGQNQTMVKGAFAAAAGGKAEAAGLAPDSWRLE